MEILLLLIGLALGALVGALAVALWVRSHPIEARESIAALERRVADDTVIKDGLNRLAEPMRDLEHNRATWQGPLRAPVDEVRHSAEGPRRETPSLSPALPQPPVRGRWRTDGRRGGKQGGSTGR